MITTRTERMQRGSTWKRQYQLNDFTGAPVSIAAPIVIQFTIKTDIKATVNVLQKTVGAGITITDPTQATFVGQFTVALQKADTAALAPGDYVYDLTAKLANGDEPTLIASSRFTIVQETGGAP